MYSNFVLKWIPNRRKRAINLHLYHYAGNNPVKYTDPDGKFLINSISLGVYSARKFEANGNKLPVGVQILDSEGRRGYFVINGITPKIKLENNLDQKIVFSQNESKNPNYELKITSTATKTKNDNFEIKLKIEITQFDSEGRVSNYSSTSGTIAFASPLEVDVDINGNPNQHAVDEIANTVIKTVLEENKWWKDFFL